jgi:hypothetical protein
MGGTADEQGLSIAVDASGNVYTTGNFEGTADFNPDPAVTNTLTSAGNDDIFISKLDAAGNFVWAKRLGGTADDVGASIAADASGNVYTTGYFAGTGDFDPDPAVTNTLTSAGAFDIFISKLDAAGNFIWARRMGGTAAAGDFGGAVAVDAVGNVYTTGAFNGTADFNPDPAVTNTLSTAGSSDIYISKLDAAGNYVWARRMGGSGSSADFGESIALDASGNVYTTGRFSGTSDFNPDPAVTNSLTSAGIDDIFISKLDAAGNYVWAKQMGGISQDYGSSIAIDAFGNSYTTGVFNGTADFNSDPAATNNLISAGGEDIFISKLDASGNLVWAKQLGGTSNDLGFGLAIDASGNVVTTGEFRATSDFNPDAATANNLTSAGGSDIFVVKLNQPGTLPIHFSSVKAFQKSTGVQVEWNIATESNIHIYEVEKSSDGIHFTKAGHFAPASNNNASVSYHWLDNNPYDGNTFYRLKAVEISGSFKYSSIVSINMSKGRSSIVINPNPVIDGVINLQLQNQPRGTYNVRLFNSAGQLMYSNKVQHQGGSSVQTIRVDNKLARGIYQLHVTNGLTQMMHKIVL